MGDYTEFQAPQKIDWQNGERTIGLVQYDNRMNVQFYAFPVINPIKSREIGREFKETKDYVRIAPPGEKLNIVVREATEDDKRRYAQQWALYRSNREQIPDGTPVSLLFPGDPAIPDNLRAWGFYTVEQVANASSDAINNIMGMQTYVNRAKAFMDQADKGVGFHKLQKELEDRDSKIRVLTQQMDLMKNEINSMRQTMMGAQAGQMQFQAGMAQHGQMRPTFPNQQVVQPQMPYTGTQGQPIQPIAQAFDVQSAQINAVQEQTVRRGRPQGSKNKPKPEAPEGA